jgi:hypothetical protein
MHYATCPRETLRAELEATRIAYHQLLETLTDEDWERQSGNTRLTVGELMSHLAVDVGFMTRMVEWAIAGRSVDPPRWLFAWLNPIRARWGARRATRHTVGAAYDRGHAALCAVLDRIQDDEWEKAAVFLGRYTTVAGVFRLPDKHFEQHAADIERGLGRA